MSSDDDFGPREMLAMFEKAERLGLDPDALQFRLPDEHEYLRPSVMEVLGRLAKEKRENNLTQQDCLFVLLDSIICLMQLASLEKDSDLMMVMWQNMSNCCQALSDAYFPTKGGPH